MAKVTLQTIQNLDNPPTVVTQVNYNFSALQTIIDTLLSRDGALPNSMLANLDMNGNRILNLPVPVSPTEPARHGDIQQYVDLAQDWANEAGEQADRAESEADQAEAASLLAEAALADLLSRYIGSFPTDPTVDGAGNPPTTGTIYFNTTTNQLHVYALDYVHVNADDVFRLTDRVVISHWVELPVPTLAGLSDVNITGINSGDLLQWNGTTFVDVAPSASLITFSYDDIFGDNVQEALEEIVDRTSLGVYDLILYAQGLPGFGEEMFRMVASRTFWIPVSATGSVAGLRAAPVTNSVTFSLRKNGVQFGTILFNVSSTTGVFTVAGETTFNNGDIFSIVAATNDAAVRDLSITLACRR